MGEFVYEWKRSSAPRTRFDSELDAGVGELKPVWANPEERRFEMEVWPTRAAEVVGRASICRVRELFPESERRWCWAS